MRPHREHIAAVVDESTAITRSTSKAFGLQRHMCTRRDETFDDFPLNKSRVTKKLCHRMPINLFNHHGGRATAAVHVPSDAEGFALATALALYWSKQMDNTHPQFYTVVASEVKRLGCTRQTWTAGEIATLVQEKLWKKVPGGLISTYLQKILARSVGDDRLLKRGEFVGAAIYLFVVGMSAASGTYDDAMELAREARLADVLHCKQLGGSEEEVE